MTKRLPLLILGAVFLALALTGCISLNGAEMTGGSPSTSGTSPLHTAAGH